MQAAQVIFEVIRFFPPILLLIYAAICDYKTGYAPNKLWKYIPIPLFFTCLTLLFYPQNTILTLVSAGLTIVLSLALFYLKMWGGADSKALILIAVATPLPPIWITPMLYPMIILVLTGITAVLYSASKHPKNLFKQKIRYLPFMAAAYIFTAIFFFIS
jgi:preflagellin peptidase FlaK